MVASGAADADDALSTGSRRRQHGCCTTPSRDGAACHAIRKANDETLQKHGDYAPNKILLQCAIK